MALSTAALTIAGWAGSAVVKEVIRMGFSYMRDNVLPVDTKAELKRLETALPQITAVMSIAEALKMKDPSADQWVEQFKQAVEASEDVLDELEYKKLEDEVGRDEVGESASSSKDRLKRLKVAVTMLDEAAKGVESLLLAANAHGIHNLFESRQEARKDSSRETTSFPVERELFGRKVEKDKIIDWLKRPTNAPLSLFGIVGVGGVGKTTLVQFAYQEMRRSNHFDKIIWVCVSTNFSVEDITRKMLGELGENNFNNRPLNALQETLQQNIHLKKILLILDDIWDDEKMSHWDQLIALLTFVQEGSKIIFTTRMKSVANLLTRVISTEHESLSLQGLGEQELRLLFQSYAFRGFNLYDHRDLQAIGDQILKMLRGSPLAAKVIGRLLNSNMNNQNWRSVLNQGSLFKLEEAKDVVEVLKLSYYHLPANLQACFRFCSIFSQDHQFDKDDLIRMWICSGFVQQQSSEEKRPEVIGEDYFNLLLSRSFFEDTKSRKGERRFVMHDLVHELAQNVSHGECCRREPNEKSITIPSTVRHVYVHECEMEKVSHLENLRSLVVTTYSDSFVLPKNLIKKSLRLLKIYGNNRIEMPKEISCLVHLRYLSMEGRVPSFSFSFKDSLLPLVNKLYHLQVLEIPGDNSAIDATGMINLLRLRHMRLPKKIMQSIHGVHKLTSLQELTFFVGQERGQRINELSTLKNLRHLFIENIENIGDHTEAKNANLLRKNNLMSLSLKWTSTPESIPIHHEEIIDNLLPPPTLMELTINNYNGQRSPNWMVDSPHLNLLSLKLLSCPLWKNQLFSVNMSYLKILVIHGCQNLDKLPDIPLSLIELRISNVGLTSLPALYQNYGNNIAVPLSLKSSLRVVKIVRCPNLIYLHGFLQQDNIDFQFIKEIEVCNCKNLVHLPMGAFGKFVWLQKLNISYCPMLMADDKHSTLLPMALKNLSISSCCKLEEPLLESASSLPTLTYLRIYLCANISRIPSSENAFRSLNELHIKGCKKLVEHSSREQAHGVDRGSSLASLKIKELHIDNLSLLLIEPLRSRSFVSCLEVSSSPSFSSNQEVAEALQDQWLLQNSSTLKRLCLINVFNLNTLPATMVRLTVLEELEIWGTNLLEELPELPASLRSLYINGARSLKSLPATMVGLIALKRLQIHDVYLLEKLPELPTSLRELIITEASSLKLLPATMARLTALEWLQINGADLLEELPELPASLKFKRVRGHGGHLL